MSTLSITTLQDRASSDNTPVLDAIHGSARAWVNFDGTGTVAIRASYNVSSITDNGTGDYNINFTNVMPDIFYAVNSTIIFSAELNTNRITKSGTHTTSSVQIVSQNVSSTATDQYLAVTVFR